MKQIDFCDDDGVILSPLAWGRGLKLFENQQSLDTVQVAPRVGAWIETSIPVNGYNLSLVAPRVGAWIETILLQLVTLRLGRPSRGGVD